MQENIAFLSEWGNDVLDFSNRTAEVASTHFVVTALIVRRDDIPEAKRILEAVRQRHFEGNPIDSDAIGMEYQKRKEILEDIDEAPFKIFAVIVDKRKLIGEGLRYKGSFFKFLHSLADRELYRQLPNLDLMAGRPSDNGFVKGFVRYVEQTHVSNLFNEATFGFIGLHDNVFVQAASYIAGTLARCYDETVITDQRNEFVEVLQRKLLSIEYFPDTFGNNLVSPQMDSQKYDSALTALSINLASDFLHRKSFSPVPQMRDQVTCLEYLLFHFQHINASRYITSFELMEHIRVRKGKKVTLHYFQTKVIAPMRDAGVLIASTSRGYKLPANESDLHDFIAHSNVIIAPVVNRIKKFRDQVHQATDGKIDVLGLEEYTLIRRAINDPKVTPDHP